MEPRAYPERVWHDSLRLGADGGGEEPGTESPQHARYKQTRDARDRQDVGDLTPRGDAVSGSGERASVVCLSLCYPYEQSHVHNGHQHYHLLRCALTTL
jgi:hypothetical protein